MNEYLISKDNGQLQIPYGEYVELMNKMKEAREIEQIKERVIALLQQYSGGHSAAAMDAIENVEAEMDKPEAPAAEESKENSAAAAQGEKVAMEFSAEKPEEEGATPKSEETAAPAAQVRKSAQTEIPPIKKDIEDHFNRQDGSGRVLNVFKQYYTCLNESCGGIVRVTMKDGVCSLWNYDEWEEFAFVDIHDGDLRISLDPRYEEALASLDVCEVPRLLASRRKLTAVQVDDLNKTMLGVLTKAFEEVGLALG